jgi:hypothetical protein
MKNIKFIYKKIKKIIITYILIILDTLKFFTTPIIKLNIKAKYNNALILGNGPSLKDFLEKNILLNEYELFVCNGFSTTEYYKFYKPSHYAILDPAYFNLDLDIVKNKDIAVLEIWESIFNDTEWPLTIYTSYEFKKYESQILNKFNKNTNINFKYLRKKNFESILRYSFYNKTNTIIGSQTVVQLLVTIALYNEYQNLYLAGVDHNWIENIKYDNSTHQVYLNDEHFYGSNKLIYGEGVYKNVNLSLDLFNLSKSFKEFNDIYNFSNYLNKKMFLVTRSFLHFIPFKNIT